MDEEERKKDIFNYTRVLHKLQMSQSVFSGIAIRNCSKIAKIKI